MSISSELAAKLRDKRIADVGVNGTRRLTIRFTDGSSLLMEATHAGLVARYGPARDQRRDASRPTKRQNDYLVFIAKYIARFGRSPAESDIERHFLVSAPSVNQMMQTLERRGFIVRQRGVARSIQLRVEPSSPAT